MFLKFAYRFLVDFVKGFHEGNEKVLTVVTCGENIGDKYAVILKSFHTNIVDIYKFAANDWEVFNNHFIFSVLNNLPYFFVVCNQELLWRLDSTLFSELLDELRGSIFFTLKGDLYELRERFGSPIIKQSSETCNKAVMWGY